MYSRADSARFGTSGLSRPTLTPTLTSRCDKRSSAVRMVAAVGNSGCVSMTDTRKFLSSPWQRILHLGQTAQSAYRCLHRDLQRRRQAVGLDQIRGPSKAPQSPFRGPMILGTSFNLGLRDELAS